jgi:hypothetical protein
MSALTGNVALRAVAPSGVAPKRSPAAAAAAPVAAASARKAAFMGQSDSSALRAQPLRASAPRGRALTLYASSSPAPVVLAAAAAPKGADLKALSYSVLAGVVIWLLPAPVGVTLQAWHLLAHFVATIVGIITSVRGQAANPNQIDLPAALPARAATRCRVRPHRRRGAAVRGAPGVVAAGERRQQRRGGPLSQPNPG